MGYCPWGCKKSDMTEATEHEQNLRSDIPFQGASVALVVKNLPTSAGDVRHLGSIPGSGKSPGGGHDNPLQYSCLRNPMARGALQATVHRSIRVGQDLVPKQQQTVLYLSERLFSKVLNHK